jgi:hypothetical protein
MGAGGLVAGLFGDWWLYITSSTRLRSVKPYVRYPAWLPLIAVYSLIFWIASDFPFVRLVASV